eukprot:TRINITY_DN28888_c0_g1_i1.p1 TRINITY_DN28888_c0_g1~~TRINITY_DN28888_c0_g1_i1.p1  ORF type:complete len:696 (+),score=118.32 TRINITY_DN28888_c0_g1_i1:70-2088(+)
MSCSFLTQSFSDPQWCARCRNFLWGMSDQGQSCRSCKEVRCHTCSAIPSSCPKAEPSGAAPAPSGDRRLTPVVDRSSEFAFGAAPEASPAVSSAAVPTEEHAAGASVVPTTAPSVTPGTVGPVADTAAVAGAGAASFGPALSESGYISTYGSGREWVDRLPCKSGCGRKAAPGKTKKGNLFDTCCRKCATNPGAGIHDPMCIGPEYESARLNGGYGGSALPAAPTRAAAAAASAPQPVLPVKRLRPVCTQGSRCRRRDAMHLKMEAHFLDADYVDCCEAEGKEPETLSLKVLFDWTDSDGSGKLSKKELEAGLSVIGKLAGWENAEDQPPITEEGWKRLDEDGNGVVNFNEFASWAGPRLGLPLGLRDKIRPSKSDLEGTLVGKRCGVLGCPCLDFAGHGRKCEGCRHGREKHLQPVESGEVDFPHYWKHRSGKFQTLEKEDRDSMLSFQVLFDQTHKRTSTRDRAKHNPTNPAVPKGYTVKSVRRNENSHNFQEFFAKRTELGTRIAEGGPVSIAKFANIKTVMALRNVIGDDGRLRDDCNEWYLWHGTNLEVAEKICATDFQVSCAGTNTGTLYGRGLYFAESITKADEYAKANTAGNYAVLLCRVLGGKVLYTDEVSPNPEDLVHQCVEGPYDSVLGDRERIRGTFREFVLFDSEDVYPEYIVEYQRDY